MSVAAAADLLIQAASRASPTPSLSPHPPIRQHSPGAQTAPSGRDGTRPGAIIDPSASVRLTATTETRATHRSASATASASTREKMNISRLLRAAETVDRSSARPPLPLPVRAARHEGRRDGRRAVSPLFVENGLVGVDEGVVENSVSDDDDGDDEMPGMGREMGMTPEPRSSDDEMGDKMCDTLPGQVFEMGDDERGLVAGPSRVPGPGAGEREMVVPNGDVSRGVGKDVAGTKVPVARRLRELYRSAVLVKDRKGRMRRVGGGLVGRREGM